MKTLIPLTVGVAALAAMTFSLSAGPASQSPRAKANDAKIVTVSTSLNTAADTRAPGVSPRVFANQAKVVSGTGASAATTMRCSVVGSPKQLANANNACCAANSTGCRVAGPCCAMK